MLTKTFSPYFLCLSALTAQVLAAPSSSQLLVKRQERLIDCNPEQTAKIGFALKNMADLARSSRSFVTKDKIGFKHYFRDQDLDTFKEAMSVIAANNDPTNKRYIFEIRCKPTERIIDICSSGEDYAITNFRATANRERRNISLCPKFFDAVTGTDSKNNLPLIGSVNPDEQRKAQVWCDQDNYRKFTMAGYILLREVTHLGGVAQEWFPSADNSKNKIGAQSFGSGMEDARRLKLLWEMVPQRSDAETPPPLRNADSYAAAATELWVEMMCKKAFVPPQLGV